MEIKAQQFVTSTGRQVLTDNGQQGMGGVAGIGSTTEKHQGAWRKQFLRTARTG